MILPVSNNKHRNLLISIVMFMTMATLRILGETSFITLLLELISVGFFVLFLIANPRGSIYKYHYPRKALFIVLLGLSIIAVLRGFLEYGTGLTQIKEMFSRPKMIWPYFFPFLIGCSAFTFDYKLFYKWSSIITVAYAILVVFNLNELISTSFLLSQGVDVEKEVWSISTIFSVFSAPLVIFLQRDIVPKRTWYLAVFNFIVVFFVAIINARRSSVFGISLVLFFAFIKDKRNRWISAIAFIFLILSMYESGMLDFFISRVGQDSRSMVIDNFYEDMDSKSWIIGRGAAGTYFDSLGVFQDIDGKRSEIETGYLHLILKGGILYMVTYVLALAYAAYLGVFRSKNSFVHSFGIIIFISLLELIPYGIPTWNFKYLSIWMGVAICLNNRFREMSNQEVKDFLHLE